MIELETTKLGEGLRTLAPGLLPIRWPTQVVTIYANKLANDPFVGLRVAINDVHADHDIGQPLSYHYHCAIFLRDTKKF